MNPGPLDPYFRPISFVVNYNRANMVVATNPANLFLDVAQANVIASSAFTNVSIDTATTNIPDSELTGTAETRPNNIALLPVIRY
jgi:hypothetical protein